MERVYTLPRRGRSLQVDVLLVFKIVDIFASNWLSTRWDWKLYEQGNWQNSRGWPHRPLSLPPSTCTTGSHATHDNTASNVPLRTLELAIRMIYHDEGQTTVILNEAP